jgi:hypothetical protein
MSGLYQPSRHVRAHIAETDKADVHHTFLPDCVMPGFMPGIHVLRSQA